jgi:hypothetical protein
MRRIFGGRLLSLLVCIVTTVVLTPFMANSILGQIVLWVLAAAASIATIYGLRLGKRAMILTLLLGILSVLTGTLSASTGSNVGYDAAIITSAAFYGLLIGLLIRYIVRAERVTGDILFGAVSVYLLIGIVFSLIFRFIDIVNPEAFAVAEDAAGGSGAGRGDFTYFSFVTLTTLGYGDIRPVSGYARTFAFLEAITGTLYIAVLISRLVSLYVTDTIMSKKK